MHAVQSDCLPVCRSVCMHMEIYVLQFFKRVARRAIATEESRNSVQLQLKQAETMHTCNVQRYNVHM